MDEFSIWIVIREESFRIYRSLGAAQRACVVSASMIEEWRCGSDSGDRFRHIRTFIRDEKGNFRCIQ
jgi:hypothetical protein